MAIRFFPIPNGIETAAETPSENHTWKLIGTDDKNTCNSYALAGTPSIVSTVYGVLYRMDLQCSRTAYNHWTVRITYGSKKIETGEWTWDFDTTGGTVHITNAKEEVRRYPTATAPDQKGAIAVDGHEVKGIEIVIPAMRMNVSYKHPSGVLTIPYAKYLRSLTGTVNSSTMLGHSAGEVLFLGARGADGEVSEASVSYSFAMSENATLSFGGIAGIVKKGHEAAWIRYADTIETADGKQLPVRTPKFVYVDRVYDEVDMAAALGFGG